MAMDRTTKIYKAIVPFADILLSGKILAIDPSTGSQSSMPGYAWFEKGKLKESGVIQVPLSLNRSQRLFEISRTIREEFPVPDGLIVEYIPPITYRGKGMNKVSLMALQKAIGAIIASHPYEVFIEVPSASWKKYKPSEYVKSDEYDAISIGLCAMAIAKQVKIDTEEK